MLREGSLFTGAGGGLYGSRLLGWRTEFCVEKEPYCQRVLRARMADGWFDECPIYDDVFAFDGTPWRGKIDVLSAGFPCQGFSQAGKRLGGNDPRNGWPHTIRLVREIAPPFVWLENSAALVANDYFGTILSDLSEGGYDAVWLCGEAADVGAPHGRLRMWLLAWRQDLADADGVRQLQQLFGECEERRWPRDGGAWAIDPATCPAESRVDRMAHGVAHRRDRERALGNGQVPQHMVASFLALSAIAREQMQGGEQ